MTWFLLASGIFTVIVLAVLLAPLVQRRTEADDSEPIATLFQRQLAAVEEDLIEGRLTADEAETARAEITRRLLIAAERAPEPATAVARAAPDMAWRYGAAVAIGGLLPAAALAIYWAIGSPTTIEQDAAPANLAHGAEDVGAAISQLQAHLRRAPDDLKGWSLLGRSLASLGRFDEASDAFRRALALAPDNAALHAEYGETLVLAAGGAVTPAAAAEFARAPQDPRSRYYEAEAALQRGDPATAKRKFEALLAAAPPDAPWRQAVADRLAELSPAAAAPAGTAQPPGPTPAQVAAAQAMSPAQRLSMIRGMVERLAQRLEQHPDDKAGWERLAHAYDVPGEPEKATAARQRAAATGETVSAAAGASPPAADAPKDPQSWLARVHDLEGEGRASEALAALKEANAANPGNLVLLKAYLDALTATLKEGKPSPEIIAIAAQVNALDANEPDALWYLGLAAEQRGDRYRAISYWARLLALLPATNPQHAMVQHELDALR